MNEIDSPVRERLHADLERIWGNPRGWRALSVVNHSVLGLRFMGTALVFFLIGGILAMLMRTQLAMPDQRLLDAEFYNQAFTMHGTVMMFLFAVPMLEGLAVYLIPKMIGARDLVFPRLSAFGYWCYLFGGLILISSLFLGIAPNSGWFMYTPLSSAVHSPGSNSDFWLLGVTFIEISAVSTAIELVVSILRSRTAGMSLDRMPLFAWYILGMSLMIVVGFPPLILGSILLELERAAGLPFFDVARGGDPVLWQHLFWLFGHPEVYIIFLPAAGIVSTLIPVFAQRPIVGYRWVVLSIITTGFLSFSLWVHHMFTVGIPHLAQAFFSAASMLVAIPTAIQVFVWLATLWTGKPLFRLPMLWLVGFLVVFVAGGLTGVMLALVPFNWQVHDTHFVVAHMHYVLVGGMFFPLVAGLYYWLPHVSGRMPSEHLGRWGFWLTFIGFNLTFLIMHWTGLLGMPRRVYTYEAGLGWDLPNLVSSIGGFVMAIGIATVLLDIALHFRFGRVAPRNPWHADTLEWATDTPPRAYNFASQPDCATRHPLWEHLGLAEGRHWLSNVEHGRRETLGTDPVSGTAREIMRLPGNSWLPLVTALGLAVVCIALLARSYPTAALAALVSVALLLRWSWVNGLHPALYDEAGASPGVLPLHPHSCDGPGLWGMGVTLLSNASLFLALLFGWFYLWTVAPLWQAPATSPLPATTLLIAGLLLTAATLWMRRIVMRLRSGTAAHLQMQLWGVAGLGLAHIAVLTQVLLAAPLSPTRTAHDAVITVFLGYALMHAALACALAALQALRVRRAYVGQHAPYEPVIVEKWWSYTLLTFWLTYGCVVLFPAGWGG
ncbi:MAG: cytochrome c oxidase subunit I [Thiobacillus sp.]|nr:cytochrome c oxidase subunit I [Thiobacillus sp.]